jgi:hypothetical protein
VARYEKETSIAAKRAVCSSCGSLLLISDIHAVKTDDPMLQLLKGDLDHCGRHGSTWDLCSSYLTSLTQRNFPKFSAINLVNVMLCQHYPSVLEDLTPVKECIIAKCHPLGIILKLRPGGRLSPVNYRALRGHFIVFPQDLEPLL